MTCGFLGAMVMQSLQPCSSSSSTRGLTCTATFTQQSSPTPFSTFILKSNRTQMPRVEEDLAPLHALPVQLDQQENLGDFLKWKSGFRKTKQKSREKQRIDGYVRKKEGKAATANNKPKSDIVLQQEPRGIVVGGVLIQRKKYSVFNSSTRKILWT